MKDVRTVKPIMRLVSHDSSKDRERNENNNLPASISIEEHKKIIDEVAKKASRETIDSLRSSSRGRGDRGEDRGGGDRGEDRGGENRGGEDSGGDDDTGIEELDFFAPKTNKSIKNMVSSVATLKKAFEQPPSQIESMLYNAFTQNIANKLTGTGEIGKKGLLHEAVTSFTHGLGQRGPELIDSLSKNFGSEWVKNIAQGFLNPGSMIGGSGGGSGGGQGGGGSGQGGGSGGGQGSGGQRSNEDAINQIMALDPNNPEHVSAYAEIQGGIDINDARNMLMVHQDIFTKMIKKKIIEENPGGSKEVNREINREINRETNREANNRGNVNPEIPPVWAQALMGKIVELEQRMNNIVGNNIVGNNIVGNGSGMDVDRNNSTDNGSRHDKVYTAREFKKELEEETRRGNEKNMNVEIDDMKINKEKTEIDLKTAIATTTATETETEMETIVTGNKWEEDPNAAVGVVDPSRAREEKEMKKNQNQIHDASVELVMQEIENSNIKIDKEIEKKDILRNTIRDAHNNISSTALCPKCKKIKVLVETNKGRLCEECKRRLGL